MVLDHGIILDIHSKLFK